MGDRETDIETSKETAEQIDQETEIETSKGASKEADRKKMMTGEGY